MGRPMWLLMCLGRFASWVLESTALGDISRCENGRKSVISPENNFFVEFKARFSEITAIDLSLIALATTYPMHALLSRVSGESKNGEHEPICSEYGSV